MLTLVGWFISIDSCESGLSVDTHKARKSVSGSLLAKGSITQLASVYDSDA